MIRGNEEKMTKKRLFSSFVVAFLVLGLFLVSMNFVLAENQELNPAPGAVIKPSAIVQVGAAQLRTPEDMEKAEAILGPVIVQDIPFMPTMDPEDYILAKAKAEANVDAENGGRIDSAKSEDIISLAPPTLKTVNRDGNNQVSGGGAYPPDTHGAAGHTQYVQIVNCRVSVYTKTGTFVKSTALNAFFGSTEFVFDPTVVYDSTWKRWVMLASRRSASATDTVRRFFLAVSTTQDAAGSYWIYQPGFGGGPFNDGDWFDYPKLGMNQDAVLITSNVFDTPAGGYKFAVMLPIAKARVYNGLGFGVPIFTGLLGTLVPPIVLDQNKDAYFVAANNHTHLHLYRGNNLSNAYEATLVLQSAIDVTDYAAPPNAPQVGTAQKLDTLDGRFETASTQYSDSLWNVHTIYMTPGYATPKFYQIDIEGTGANTIKQQGVFYEGSYSHDFNASITANTSGYAFVTWNSTDAVNPTTASRHNARIRYSGRASGDAAGFISAGYSLVTSSTYLSGNPSSTSGVQRWGDYSYVSLDPSSFYYAWISNEKINYTNQWGSQIARIGFF